MIGILQSEVLRTGWKYYKPEEIMGLEVLLNGCNPLSSLDILPVCNLQILLFLEYLIHWFRSSVYLSGFLDSIFFSQLFQLSKHEALDLDVPEQLLQLHLSHLYTLVQDL